MATFSRSEGPGVAAGFLGSILVAGGIAVAGWFIAGGISYTAPRDTRTASFIGAAEREIVADFAVWSFALTATGAELAATQARLDASSDAAVSFLLSQGLDEAEIIIGPFVARDALDDLSAPPEPARRYQLRRLITVRSANVESVAEASLQTDILARDIGVLIGDADGPHYTFGELSAMRAELVREAYENARETADRFAIENDARIGEIQSAQAGRIQVYARQAAPGAAASSQILQRARLETEITYRLND